MGKFQVRLYVQVSAGQMSSCACRLFQGTKLERINDSDAKLTFADIAGIDNVKAEVYELVAFLQNPKRFMDLGAVSPSGILLVGGPGTGNLVKIAVSLSVTTCTPASVWK